MRFGGLAVSVAVMVLAAISLVVFSESSFAQSKDDVLQRLEAKLDSQANELKKLAKENAALRDRMKQIESTRQTASLTSPEAKRSTAPSASIQSRQASTQSKVLDAYASAPPTYFSWTGFYVGGNIGGGLGQNNFGNLSTVAGGPSSGVPGGNGTISGILGGIQGGYNYQMGWAVVGIEGEFDWSGLSGHTIGHPGDAVGDQMVQNTWLASVTGRVGGIVGENTLVYLKGGPAWANFKYNVSVTFFGTPEGSYPEISDTRFGWTLGFGTEYHFDRNWSAKIEYDYYNFGTKTVAFPQGTPNTGFNVPFTSDISQDIHTVKIGANYKFY
jgi:outer membrane immunogenic protein